MKTFHAVCRSAEFGDFAWGRLRQVQARRQGWLRTAPKLVLGALVVLVVLVVVPALGAAAIPTAGCGDPPVAYWDLPTGSHLGYVKIAAADAGGPRPALVTLHGGPGASQVFAYGFACEWYRRLAALGFDVYVYDQIGSGVSARLNDPRDYTVTRHVADLEAIRQRIGCERLTLIGESWGAALAANYIAMHPGRVERAVFVAPGAIDAAEWKRTIYPYATPRVVPEFMDWLARTRRGAALQRYAQLDAMLQRGDVRAAYAFAGDAEMDALQDEFVKDVVLRMCVHDQARLVERDFSVPGMGWWASMMTICDAVGRSRAVRAWLAGVEVPALILRGDADYIPAKVAEQYVETFRGSKIVAVPEAGHLIWMDQPDRYRNEIEFFLAPERALELRNP